MRFARARRRGLTANSRSQITAAIRLRCQMLRFIMWRFVLPTRRKSLMRLFSCCIAFSLYLALACSPAMIARAAGPLANTPASFSGTLPCADCPGIDWHLDLWPTGRFHLARRFQGRVTADGQVAHADVLGRWQFDAAGTRLRLLTEVAAPVQLELVDALTLRLLDTRGKAIDSALPYELTRNGVFRATELAFSGAGEFRYFADAATFRPCGSTYQYPVMMDGRYLELERAYANAGKTRPGAPLSVRISGRIVNRQAMEGEGPPQSLRVDELLDREPPTGCAQVPVRHGAR